MIAYISGEIEEITEDGVVIDNNGIGYFLYMPSRESAKLSNHMSARLMTYLKVAEDDMSLYGFLNKDSLNMFKLLLNVNGIGPKAALAILGVMDPDDIRLAVAAEDSKTISQAPGVGPKTAKRLILELKDKIDYVSTIDNVLDKGSKQAESAEIASVREETMMALLALGYSNSESYRALAEIEITESDNASSLLRQALKKLS